MPLLIGKMKVNVSLCGSVPRSHLSNQSIQPSTCVDLSSARCANALRAQLKELTSSDFNKDRKISIPSPFCDSTVENVPEKFSDKPTHDRSKINAGESSQSSSISQTSSQSHSKTTDIDKNITMQLTEQGRTLRLAPSPPVIDPPPWAVQAKGEARLEPVCEALGTHSSVNLTARAFFRIGRSPSSDVQLWHETSSRRHALLFHHPNGQCYLVDCGSAHGTFINGKRVRTTPEGGMVVPHRVRRGALIRFGGPGAPAFILKSLTAGMSSKLCPPVVSSANSSALVKHNTVLNSLGAVHGGILKNKRTFSVISHDEEDSSTNKRQRCTSPVPEMQEPLRLVSPDNLPKSTCDIFTLSPSRTKRRVTFSSNCPEAFYPALVTPDELSSDDDSCTGVSPN
mmetsp:Transcript_2774/g.3643  ORF Transcript_2774/g.3643 Transcript_2774/m.3643 type:complete len:397 (+) Transcript_2774:437-1627(+)